MNIHNSNCIFTFLKLREYFHSNIILYVIELYFSTLININYELIISLEYIIASKKLKLLFLFSMNIKDPATIGYSFTKKQ